jgi:integrase
MSGLLDQLCEATRRWHYRIRTEDAHVSWTKSFILFHGKLLAQLQGTAGLAAGRMDGSGLRLMECVRLRVQEIDIDQVRLIIRDSQSQTDRATVLPAATVEPLRRHVEHERAFHRADLRDGFGRVHPPSLWPPRTPRPTDSPAGRTGSRRAGDPRTGIVRQLVILNARTAHESVPTSGKPAPRRPQLP